MIHRIVPHMFVAAALTAFVAAAAVAGETHEGKVVEASKGKLTMTDLDGKNKHTMDLSSNVRITLSGKSARIDDLKKDAIIEVTTEQKDGKTVVTQISVRGRARETKGTTTTKRSYSDPDKTPQLASRASKLIGTAVKNEVGEDLGKI